MADRPDLKRFVLEELEGYKSRNARFVARSKPVRLLLTLSVTTVVVAAVGVSRGSSMLLATPQLTHGPR